tara:strand:+ start:196 stop:462 length:267 start_codon:yes stop_codon:yes gene_type:complete
LLSFVALIGLFVFLTLVTAPQADSVLVVEMALLDLVVLALVKKAVEMVLAPVAQALLALVADLVRRAQFPFPVAQALLVVVQLVMLVL